MRKRILFLSQWFDPEPGAKGLLFARELTLLGFDVEVITGFPNYPGGKLYPGYKLKAIQREVIDGVHITRVPLYPSHDQSSIKRILNYASFALSATLYGIFGAKRADVMYAYHPPLTVGVAASLIRLFRRIPVVYDVQDMWPDTLKATGMLTNPSALLLVGKVCSWVYSNVDHIVVLSPGFKRVLMERDVPERKLSVIYNWADESVLNKPVGKLPQNFPGAEKFKIVFAGNVGKAQALDAVLDAAEILQKESAFVCFIIIGSGIDLFRLKQKSTDMGLQNLLFFPAVPMIEVGVYLSSADVLLVHLSDDPLFTITIPSKTQAYMAVGKPLLMAVAGDASNLVNQAGAGVVAEPESADSLVAAAKFLASLPPEALSEMGDKARKFYVQNLSMHSGVRIFGEVFNGLMDGRKY